MAEGTILFDGYIWNYGCHTHGSHPACGHCFG